LLQVIEHGRFEFDGMAVGIDHRMLEARTNSRRFRRCHIYAYAPSDRGPDRASPISHKVPARPNVKRNPSFGENAVEENRVASHRNPARRVQGGENIQAR
jgi:hypothetical protein